MRWLATTSRARGCLLPAHDTHQTGLYALERESCEVEARNVRPLTTTLILTVSFCLVEVVAGVLTNSLALLSDAGHMFTDAAALGLSVFAMRLAQRPPTARKTFGYHRV